VDWNKLAQEPFHSVIVMGSTVKYAKAGVVNPWPADMFCAACVHFCNSPFYNQYNKSCCLLNQIIDFKRIIFKEWQIKFVIKLLSDM
jgi:hypothetical protein